MTGIEAAVACRFVLNAATRQSASLTAIVRAGNFLAYLEYRKEFGRIFASFTGRVRQELLIWLSVSPVNQLLKCSELRALYDR